MKRRKVLLLSALGMCVFLFTSQLLASDAKELYQQGVAAYDAGNFDEAANHFEAAYDERPSWKLHFNIGQSRASGKKYGLALQAFEKYLTEGGDDISEGRMTELLKELDRLRKLVGYAKIVAPKGAKISIDGRLVGTAPLDSPVPLTIGQTHTVQVVTEDGPMEQDLKVLAGKNSELIFETNKPVLATVNSETVNNDKGRSLKLAGWITIGTGAALLIGGGVTGSLALKKDKDLTCPGNECFGSDYEDAQSITKLGIITDVLIGVGATAATAGIIMLIVGKNKSSKEKVAVSPMFAPGFAGFQAGGVF